VKITDIEYQYSTPGTRDQANRLIEERQRAWDANKALLDRATRQKRDLTPEEQRAWDRANAAIDQADEAIKTYETRERQEGEADIAREAYNGLKDHRGVGGKLDPTHLTDEERFNSKLRELVDGNGTQYLNVLLAPAMAHKRLIRLGADAKELRTIIQEDSATLGGNAVPTAFSRRLVDWLEFYSGVRRLDVTYYNTGGGETLTVPTVSSHGTASIKGEGTALAEVDPTFATTTFHSWKYGSLTQVTDEMIADSGVDILAFVARDCARGVGRACDVDYTVGNGAQKPTGLMNHAGTGATAQTGSTGVPSYSNLIDLCYSVGPLYRAQGPQWFSLDTNFAKIRKITDSQNRPLWEPSLQLGEPDTLLGAECVSGPNVSAFATPATTIYPLAYGWFGGYAIRDVGALRFERSSDFAFSQDIVTFRTVLRTDGNIIDSHAVKVLADPST
jgi:HK97 family phage major capsid protein